MKKTNPKNMNKTDKQMSKYRLSIIFAFVFVIVGVTFSMSFAIVGRTTTTMQGKVSALVSANNYQQVMNVDSYLKQIKDTASLFFSEENYFKYDETSQAYDEFEKLQIENDMENRIQDLGVLENFSDFGVVYCDNHTLGWVSDNTLRMFPGDEMYKTFSENIAGLKADAGWFSTDKCNYDRIYYVKRLNPNALLFTSFYTNEFDSVFVVPDNMKEMAIRLVDSQGLVLYSTNENETGKPLEESISSVVKNQGNRLVLNDKFLVTAESCNGGAWRVVCSIPKASIMREINSLRMFTYAVSAIMSIIVIVFAFVLMHTISKPMDRFLRLLKQQADLDQLTGLLNKMAFRSIVSSVMSEGKSEDMDLFIMLDMDNFKKVNDSLGHAVGDKVLVRLAALIKRVYSADVISGRIGGDEFALYCRFEKETAEEINKIVKDSYEAFRSEFAKEFAEETEKCALSLSMGAAVVKKGEMDFDTLYKSADSALYDSKRGGKDRISFYDGKKGEKNEKA